MRDLGKVDPWQESLERSLARRGKLPSSGQTEQGRRPLQAEHSHRSVQAEQGRRSAQAEQGRRSVQTDHAHRSAQPEHARRHARAEHPRRPDRPRPDRRPSEPSPAEHRRDARPATRTRNHGRRRRRRLTSQPRLLAVGSWGILALTVIMITVGGLVDGHGAQASAGFTAARIARRHVTPLRNPGEIAPGSNRMAALPVATCRPVPKASGYVNPLAGDTLIGERIDQGVDYAGTGRLSAIGDGKITYVGTSATGWPGAFIEYRLLTGPDAGCFVYYAEGINPAPGLRFGQHVRAGQVLAKIIPGWSTGIELGWGAGSSTRTYAEKTGRWTATDDANSRASEAGKSFSGLITALGGPAGRVEG